ncbi:hypothetical protein XENTR_v10009126 [Xenopus tropicalis]|uniref:Palmitoyltransferase n=1 Tax=Xenopus tropicalis TaxID=8364 RepID=Q28DG2_XENTR|nr:palmitoyltransferase ZDHHC12 [Xenopus tropicalis]AAI70884.1 zinc finger, DHHC-type containing 12 [Xenopus tropicalis]AAI70886.1 zinc finger, DHHC-type containing 12 [Xenopus tropicalis]KAE8617582.1 hypothetical protein XENTR_v10009126 [Xenopus tropicalis]CAJ81687.1 novel protein similar to zinc finger, DHHC domain containing 12 zdhhc12 [Xenopus tropicalis]|eukprot:NP_001017307.1 probable palmitoyltransferase ZDHHC12 [Xenopus tropicalis]
MFRCVLSAGFLVRTVHTVLTWGVTLVLFLHDTDLYHQENQWKLLQPLSFGLLVLCSVLLYFAVSLMDPGYVLSDCNKKPLPTYLEQGVMIPEAPSGMRLRRCGYCLLQQPIRARHCKTCHHCVRRFDHHCPWIENCVGERNHPLFMLYLGVQFLVLLWAFRLTWSGFQFEASWTEWLKVNIFLLLAFILTGIFTFVVALLLGCHCYLISCNVTTWEFMSHHRISYLKHYDSDTNPFDKGIARNLWDFFCKCNRVAWEQVYFRGTYNIV